MTADFGRLWYTCILSVAPIFASFLVSYNKFPMESLIWLQISIADPVWCSQRADSCELRWKKYSQNHDHSTWRTIRSSWATLFPWQSEWPSAHNVLPTQMGAVLLWHRCFCRLSIRSKHSKASVPLRPRCEPCFSSVLPLTPVQAWIVSFSVIQNIGLDLLCLVSQGSHEGY